jgi:serine protease AprX
MEYWNNGLMERVSVLAVSLLIFFTAIAFSIPPSGPAQKLYDEDGDRVFENLHERMQVVPETEKIPVLIRYRDETPRAGTYAIRLPHGLKSDAVKHTFKNFPGIAASLNAIEIKEVLKDPMIEHLELDGFIKKAMDGARTSFGVQQVRSQFGFDGNRDLVSNYSTTDVVAAIVDTGINANHPDLKNKVLFWKDYVNSRAEPYDDEGHGTAVAGVLSGTGRSNRLYSGVAPGAALVVFKVLDGGGNGSISNGIAAVDEVISRKTEFNIQILNLSLSTTGSSNGRDSFSQVCNRAVSNGIVVIVAAGNEGPSPRTIGAPAASAKAITVGAGADLKERGFFLADFSSRGPTADGRIKPDLWAPGVNVRTTRRQGGYHVVEGTSFSAPFVSGVVALMLDSNPSLPPATIKTILTSTTVRWIKQGKNNEAGFGRLQAYQAIARAASITANLKPPAMPDLLNSTGTMSSGALRTFEIPVASIKYPLAITCISLNHPAGNVDLELVSPGGALIARGATLDRQEIIRVLPSTAGTFVLTLNAASTTHYALTVSADLAGAIIASESLFHNAELQDANLVSH